MMYREVLVMRKALLWFFGIGIALSIMMFAITASQSNGRTDHTDLGSLAEPAAWAAAIFAAIFGVALGNGSREAARVLWTTPVSRVGVAFEILLVDSIAIAIAFFGAFAMSIGWFLVEGLFVPVQLRGAIDWVLVAQGLMMVFAIYGWSAAVGMIGRRMPYAGLLAFPALLIWSAFGNAGGVFGKLVRAPIASNPFAVLQVTDFLRNNVPKAHDFPIVQALSWLTPESAIVVLAVTGIVGCGLATVLWSRSEVLA